MGESHGRVGIIGSGVVQLVLLVGGAPHVGHQVLVIAVEVVVREYHGIGRARRAAVDLAEPPAVELAGERCKLGSLEEARHNVLSEGIGILHDKGRSAVRPCDAKLGSVAHWASA